MAVAAKRARPWSAIPVNVQNFTTNFKFRPKLGAAGIADGMTFTIQTAVRPAAANLTGEL
jgi:hypothetical protein